VFSKQAKTNIKLIRDMSSGLLLLLSVVSLSIFAGLFLSEMQLSSWGQWIGAFIAGIALVASSYAILIQARQGESVSWNIALSRLGEIYDQACNNSRLATIINQTPDQDWKIDLYPDDINLSPTEDVWLASLFLAFEQIFVATNSLSEESKRVWRLYIRNQLNKPFIRACFIRDATVAKDYHNDFWLFVRGKYDINAQDEYLDYTIHPKYFQQTELDNPRPSIEHDLSAKIFSAKDAKFWLLLYEDEDVKRQMYAAPITSEEELVSYLTKRKVFTVFMGEKPVGGFTITPEKDHLATFGFLIHPEYRGHGISHNILKLLQLEANKLGIFTLRADVYADNMPSIRALENMGFRKFIWLEKNIVDELKNN
jgi:RimJ/RimL family protein N-acetyltransferase